jgi:hypothetical protein
VKPLLAALLLLGCAGPGNQLEAGAQPGAPGIQKFLVCAPNTVIDLPGELQGGSELVRAQIDAYLKHQGREVRWLNFYDSRQLFSEALARAKEQGDVEKTPVLFAQELAKSYPFDALVMPSILLHQTRVSDSRGAWDGVRRRLRHVNEPDLPKGGRHQSTFAEGVRAGGVTAELPVTSLHVLVFSSAGERVFEGRGGIEFIHEIDLADAARRNRFEIRARDDLFEDVEALREGIEVAFDPYLTPPEER